MLNGIIFLAFYVLAVLLCASIAAIPPQVVINGAPDRPISLNRHGAVASENKVCSQIGIDLLNAGGNAADAVRLFLSDVVYPADGSHSWSAPSFALESFVCTSWREHKQT